MSTLDVHVRPADADDLPWVADLVRGSFDPDLLPYLVAAQSGIVPWWQTILDHPDSFPTTRFLMAQTLLTPGNSPGFSSPSGQCP